MNINEMIKAMVQAQVEQAIKEALGDMLGATPEVTSAEVSSPVATPKSPKTLSREDFLALAEETEEVETPKELDFVVYGSRTARYNSYVPSDIWTINHIAITKNYGAKWSKKNGGYVFETSAQLRNFLQSYKIKTKLTDDDHKSIKAYKAERAKAKAEYYAKKASE